MNTLDELEKLLAAATPGPWKIERGNRCIQGPDTRDGDPLVLTSMMGGATKWSHSPYSEYCVPGMKEGNANAALIVAAVNALPELLAVKAERDRAQRACEQMGARITELENSLREIGAAIINGAFDTLWMGDQISDETVVDFICNLTGDDPSLLGTFARAALNQEPGQ